MTRPQPKIKPVSAATTTDIGSPSEQMSPHQHGHGGRNYEDRRRRERASRESRDSANTVAAGATTTEAGAVAHQQSSGNQQLRRGGEIDCGIGDAEHRQRNGRGDHAEHESEAPHQVIALRCDQAAQDAADARDPPVQNDEQRGRSADEYAADCCRDGSKHAVFSRRETATMATTPIEILDLSQAPWIPPTTAHWRAGAPFVGVLLSPLTRPHKSLKLLAV